MTAFALFVAFTASCLLLRRHKNHVEREVAAGRLQIRMGEGISGPSYQIAASEVLGVVFAVIALLALFVALRSLWI
jgi:hypothetical protein